MVPKIADAPEDEEFRRKNRTTKRISELIFNKNEYSFFAKDIGERSQSDPAYESEMCF